MSATPKFFTIYPAIDLRQGQVVRLVQGDPQRQTIYDADPAAAARRWLSAGARWLHVVNLDGALDGEAVSIPNRQAVKAILPVAAEFGAQVQMGGGLRSLQAIEAALSAGVSRAVLGTVAVTDASIVTQALQRFRPEHIAVALDARAGQVMVRGWRDGAGVQALELALRLARQGLRTLIYTDIARDGTGAGVDWPGAQQIALQSGLEVIASGGAHTLADIQQVRQAGLSGVIIGRALYQGNFSLEDALASSESTS